MISIAQAFYEEESIEVRAERLCVGYEEQTRNNVEYEIYSFKDGSKLTIGSNGFIGCEAPGTGGVIQ